MDKLEGNARKAVFAAWAWGDLSPVTPEEQEVIDAAVEWLGWEDRGLRPCERCCRRHGWPTQAEREFLYSATLSVNQ